MIFSLFRKNDHKAPTEELYRAITVAARHPALYLRCGIPDTVEGRFESLALHLVLVLRRLRGLPAPAPEVAQGLIDCFFRQLDASLREMGVGDMKVPKRIKKLVQGFYGRASAYDAALDAGDGAALARIFEENFAGSPEAVQALSRYAQAAEGGLAQDSLDTLLGVGPSFGELDQREEEGAR